MYLCIIRPRPSCVLSSLRSLPTVSQTRRGEAGLLLIGNLHIPYRHNSACWIPNARGVPPSSSLDLGSKPRDPRGLIHMVFRATSNFPIAGQLVSKNSLYSRAQPQYLDSLNGKYVETSRVKTLVFFEKSALFDSPNYRALFFITPSAAREQGKYVARWQPNGPR